MKKLIFLILVLLAGCAPPPATVLKVDYLKLADSITVLKSQNQTYVSRIQIMQDSITDLKERPLMASDQFIQLYKYGRLNKYYQICKRNPVQWKYYKGWSIRVFEQ